MKEILRNVTPHNAILYDILIYKYFTSTNGSYEARYKLYPIILDKVNNKKYVSFGDYNFGLYGYTYELFVLSNLKFELTSKHNKKVNIGDSCKIYINREIEKLYTENNTVKLVDKQCKYIDKVENSKIIDQLGYNLIFNVSSENFLDEINNITLFEGIIDFDI